MRISFSDGGNQFKTSPVRRVNYIGTGSVAAVDFSEGSNLKDQVLDSVRRAQQKSLFGDVYSPSRFSISSHFEERTFNIGLDEYESEVTYFSHEGELIAIKFESDVVKGFAYLDENGKLKSVEYSGFYGLEENGYEKTLLDLSGENLIDFKVDLDEEGNPTQIYFSDLSDSDFSADSFYENMWAPAIDLDTENLYELGNVAIDEDSRALALALFCLYREATPGLSENLGDLEEVMSVIRTSFISKN